MTMTRRTFVASATATLGGLRAAPPAFEVRPLTSGPKHHFFGYYGMTPWNASGSMLVGLEVPFQDHFPRPDEPAAVGLIDPNSGAFRQVAVTHAWNFQQGAMLHWNPLKPEAEVVFNDRRGAGVAGVVLDVNTGARRWLSRSVSGVSRNGRLALGLTHARLARMRKVVGYEGLTDPNASDPHPDNDGVYAVDLETGDGRLIVSVGEAYRRLAGDHPDLRGRHLWLDHTVFSRDDKRFLFLARTWTDGPRPKLRSAMFTAGVDGSGLRLVIPMQVGVSHFDWRSATEIVATYPFRGGATKHVLFTDGRDDHRAVGDGYFGGDGHCHFAPDGRWLVSDPFAAGGAARQLLLLNVETGERQALGAFELKEWAGGDLRCDLHPRWSRSGDAICFDALVPDGWTRQMHVARLKWPG